jgi:hypothetical protein
MDGNHHYHGVTPMSLHNLISGLDILGVGVMVGDLVFLALALWVIVANLDLGRDPHRPSDRRS